MNTLIEKQFYDYLGNFLGEIKKSFSNDIADIINTQYSDLNKKEYIDEIKENIYCYKENFLGEMSDLDKLFSDNEIMLLKDINISLLWNKSDADNKNAIIQYLKVFIFIFESSNKKDKEQDKEQGESPKDEFQDLLKNSLLNNEENLKSFYKNLNENKDNSIIGLAQSIAAELQDEHGEDTNIMNMMSGNNGQGLNGLISKITGKIDQQMKDGSLNHADLLVDAQKIMGQNGGLFENLFNGMGNMGNMGNRQNNTTDTDCVDVSKSTEAEVNIAKKKSSKKKTTKKKK